MKTMTQRDLAELVMLALGLFFALRLLQNVTQFLLILQMQGQDWMPKGQGLFFSAFHLVTVGGATWALLFKKTWLARVFFSAGDEKEMRLGEGGAVLADPAFWIRVAGLFVLINQGVLLVANIAGALVTRPLQFGIAWWSQSLPLVVGTLLAWTVVVKAKVIADKLIPS